MCMHIVLSGETMATIIIIICSWWVDVLSDSDSLLGTTPAPSHFEDGLRPRGRIIHFSPPVIYPAL